MEFIKNSTKHKACFERIRTTGHNRKQFKAAKYQQHQTTDQATENQNSGTSED
jgi:hypothetical protein